MLDCHFFCIHAGKYDHSLESIYNSQFKDPINTCYAMIASDDLLLI